MAVRPQGKLFTVLELGDLGDQLIAKSSRLFGCEDRFRLWGFVNRSIRWFAVARRNVDYVDRRFVVGSRVDQEIRGIEIVLTGNADQRE
jgi:hypothetical protein